MNKTKMPKGLLIGLIGGGAAVLVLAAVLIFGKVFNPPIRQLTSAGEQTVKAVSASQMGVFVKETLKNSSVNISLDVSKASEIIKSIVGMNLKLNATVDLTAYFKEKGIALDVSAKLKDTELLDGTAVLTEDALAVSSSALLGKTDYGVDLKNYAKNLKGSVFDPDENTKYALSESVYELLSSGRLTWANLEARMKEGGKLLQAGLETAVKSLSKNAEISKSGEKIEIAGEELSVTAVTVVMKPRTIRLLAEDMLNWAKKDKDLKSFVTRLAETAGEFLFKEDPQDLVEKLYDRIDELLDECEDIEDYLEDSTFTLTGYIRSGRLVQLQLDVKTDDGKSSCKLSFGPDPKAPQEISLTMKTPDTKRSITYSVTADDSKEYTANVKVKNDSSTLASGSISWDKKEGDFTVRLKSSSREYSLKANIRTSGKVTTIAPEKFTDESAKKTVKLDFVTVTIDKGAKFPSISKFTDVLSMTEDELDELVEDVKEAFQGLYGKGVAGLLGQ